MERNYKYKTRTENWINGFDLGPVYEAAAEFQIKWFHSYHNIQHLQILQSPSNAVSQISSFYTNWILSIDSENLGPNNDAENTIKSAKIFLPI